MYKITYTLLFIVCCLVSARAQPYIMDGANQGIGQYGYIEASAVTFTQMNSGSYDNIERLRARWWAESSEYIYDDLNPSNNCSASGQQDNTGNFDHAHFPNWDPGEIAYVSVHADYCGAGYDPSGGGVGFNERQFMKVDLQPMSERSYSGSLATQVLDGPKNLVGTFVLDVGGASRTLDRLWVENMGTARETDDIPNGGLILYYEAVTTGSETFDGTETDPKRIYGDYNSNDGYNNIYGHDTLGISITGAMRFYLVVDDLTATHDPSRTVNFEIINDGISFREGMDGKTLMRQNATNISQNNPMPLPVELTSFTARASEGAVDLTWETASEQDNAGFEVQRSADGANWEKLGWVEGRGNSAEAHAYRHRDENPAAGSNYYRLKQVDFDGAYEYSEIRRVDFATEETVKIYPTSVKDQLRFAWKGKASLEATAQLRDAQGRLLRTKRLNLTPGSESNWTLSDLPQGLYFVELRSQRGKRLAQERILRR